MAVLIGFEHNQALLWQIFSSSAKLISTMKLCGDKRDKKALYSFHESVIATLKKFLREGMRSIIIATPARTSYAADFLDHARRHHAYLVQNEGIERLIFTLLVGSADQPHKVAGLAKTKEFKRLIVESISQEADRILSELDKHLCGTDSVILFSLKEIECRIYDQKSFSETRKEYLLLTDKYLAESKNKNRVYRLLRISENEGVETRTVNSETHAGKRISQLGGLVFFSVSKQL